jgi:exodeoxyribonuclease V gamma subunit
LTLPPLTPGLMLVHGNQPEMLRELVVEWMKRYPLAPLENEIILVQSNGIAQWLKLALAADAGQGEAAGGCGIAAALEISLPSRFLWRVYRALLGRPAVPESSPFDESRLLWRLMRLLPEVMNDAEYAPLLGFLDRDSDRRKRFQLAERLADLFDQYQVYRADWLAAWEAGQDVLIDARGREEPLADGHRWQAALWRALLADVQARTSRSGGAGAHAAAANAGRAGVHAAFLRCAAHWPEEERPADLPRRVMVFGVSSLPQQSLEVLAVLGRWTQVLICVHNPCQHYWADIVADRDLLRSSGRPRQSRRQGMPEFIDDERLHLHAQPLLAAWGKQGRDFIGLLEAHDDDAARAGYLPHFAAIGQRIELFKDFGGATLLQQLQDDILELRPLAETRAHWPEVDPARDASIRFHVAHSPQREVEILHDQLLAACNADATLRPRDILVMVPDIDRYAPHVQAVFGLPEASDRALPAVQRRRPGPAPGRSVAAGARKAARSAAVAPGGQRSARPARSAGAAAALRHRRRRPAAIAALDPGCQHSLGVARRAACQSRFAAARRGGAPNTWLFGLRRMLLGYAVGANAAAWQGIEPYDEIGGIDAALLGPLVQLLDRLKRLGGCCASRRPSTSGARVCASCSPISSPPRTAATPSPCCSSTAACSAGRTPVTRRRWSRNCRCRWSASPGSPASTREDCRSASSAASSPSPR